MALWLRPKPPLRLGLVGSLTGRFAVLGTTGRDGAILAVEEINAAGGIAGRRVELDCLDDRGEGESCISAYETLARNGCHLVIGPFATGPATAALETINRLGTLTIAPTVAGDNLAGHDDWFLRLYPSTRTMGRQLGLMAMADGVHRLAVIGDVANGPFVSTTIEGVRESAGVGMEVVEQSFDSRRPESRSEAVGAQGLAGCDAALLVASSLDTAMLVQRLRGANPQLRLFCSSWSVSQGLIDNGGTAIDGMRTVLPVALDSGAATSLPAKYRARFGEDITHVAMLHVEAVQLLAAAVRHTGSDDPAALRAVLTSGTTIPGAPVDCRLDRFGDPIREPVPHRIVNGRLVADAGARGK